MSHVDWRSLRYGILLGSVLVAPVQAAMPALTPTPKPTSVSACKRWAAAQGEDAIYLWGMLEAGGTSKPVAMKRLAAFCLGGKKPSIVGFGSSVGFDDAYCAGRRAAPICRNR